MSLSSY